MARSAAHLAMAAVGKAQRGWPVDRAGRERPGSAQVAAGASGPPVNGSKASRADWGGGVAGIRLNRRPPVGRPFSMGSPVTREARRAPDPQVGGACPDRLVAGFGVPRVAMAGPAGKRPVGRVTVGSAQRGRRGGEEVDPAPRQVADIGARRIQYSATNGGHQECTNKPTAGARAPKRHRHAPICRWASRATRCPTVRLWAWENSSWPRAPSAIRRDRPTAAPKLTAGSSPALTPSIR